MIRFALSLLFCTSCAGIGASRVTSAAIDCATPVIAAQVGGLLSRVAEILRGGQPDWSGQLAALEASGAPALACAVNEAVRGFFAPGGGALAASGDAEAAARGRLYLAERNLVVR